MRSYRLWSLLAAIFLITSMTVFAPPFVRTANAAAALTSLTPDTGPVGTTVRVIGTVSPGAAFQIRWDSAAGPILPSGSGTAGGTGAVNRVVTILAAPAGAHAIFLVQVSDATSVSLPFTVEPRITLTPDFGPVGRTVTITGTGFQDADDGSIVVDFDGTPVVTTPASPLVSAAGSWSATFVVPTATGGPHTVNATSTGVPVPGVDATFTTPGITLSTVAGGVGTVVTVDGVGFQPNETGIRVLYDSVTVTTKPATVTADAAGVWSATFVVPTAGVGTVHTVDALGVTTTAAQVTNQAFTIAAGISVNPTTGVPGSTVTVMGTGFVTTEFVSLTFDSTVVAPVFRPTSVAPWTRNITVPSLPAGPYPVTATATTVTDTQIFTIKPGLSITPTSGAGGATVTVNGTGFQPGDTVVVTFDNVPVTTVPAVITANLTTGSWTGAFEVPTTATSGAHIVDASGDATLAADVPDQTFNLRGLSITPTTGPVGTTITVSGQGFAASETGIQITFDGVTIRTGVAATSSGTFATTALVPAASGGTHNVSAFGPTTTAATVPVEPFTVTPEIKLTGTGTKVGETVTVTGTGFAESETGVVLLWDGVVQVTIGTANANGGWSTPLIIPNAANGAHIIDARGGTTAASEISDLTLNVQHNFTMSPASGNAATTITVNGTGFFASETGIQVLIDGTPVRSGIAANVNGSWSTSFVVGPIPRGDHLVSAKGSTTTASQVPERPFSISTRLTIDPVSGFSGKVVSVTGDGFAANAAIRITFDGTTLATTPATITSTAKGEISGSFAVPAAISGAHTIAVTDGVGPINATFTITSSASTTTSSAIVGGSAGISGQGFPPNSTVTFTFEGSSVATNPATVTADANGAFTASVIVPDAARGAHPVRVSSGPTVITLSVEVTPKITVTPESGNVGASITVTGKGFGANEPITLALDNASVTTTPPAVTAAANGTFSATFAVPSVAGGAHVVKASDRAASAQGNVSVTAKVTATSSAAKVGDKVTVTASGFPGNGTVTITVDGAPASPAAVNAGANGVATAEVTVPAGAFGNHTISLSSGTAKADVTYSVSPSFSVAPNNGNVGSALTISGSGFAANSAVTVTYDGNAIAPVPSPLATNASGSFTATLTIPKSPKGPHDIAASDASRNTLHSAFTMESTAPQAPQPLSPANGWRLGNLGSVAPVFTWAPVSDPSGVTYTFQVSKDPSFASPRIQKTGMAETTYAAANTEKLARGLYYWRVKATDNASNESAYSSISTLKIGVLPIWMPTWMFFAFILIFLGIIAGALYLLVFQKTNRLG